MSQRVHVSIRYILKPERCDDAVSLGPMYVPYCFLDPFGGSVMNNVSGLLA